MRTRIRRTANVSLVLLLLCAGAARAGPGSRSSSDRAWPGWGGIHGDFSSATTGLAERWQEEGPPRLWSRPLGEGYSAIVSDATRLYTMDRRENQEFIVALDRGTGATIWEHHCPAVLHEVQTSEFGSGPQASPLLAATRLITLGFTGILHCIDTATGKPIWHHDLVRDFGGSIPYYGYSSAPLFYRDQVLVLVGGEHGVISLRLTDGRPLWKSPPSEISYASPKLINVDGQDQFVFFSPTEVKAIDPTSGAPLWSHEVINSCRVNCSSIVWGEDNLLWAATKGTGAARALKLSQRDGETRVEEVWRNPRVKVFHWNAVRVGDRVFTSSGDTSMFYSEVDIHSGKLLRKTRGFGRTNTLYADGKLILLDENGWLALARVEPEGLDFLSKSRILDSRCWTVPTLVGKTLYVRDQHQILALDLGPREETP